MGQNITGTPGPDTLSIDPQVDPGAGGYDVTLGGGADTLTLAPFPANAQVWSTVVEDFQPGVGGDDLVINYHDFNLGLGTDPIAGGFIRLVQSGADTLVQVDPRGSDHVFTTLVTLKNVDANSLIPANFGGLTPNFTPATSITAAGTVNGTSGDDQITGSPGNDILHGGAGSDHLDGSYGINTALYDGLSRAYGISLSSQSGPVFTWVSGGPEGGTDSLANIQRVQFVDGFLATGPTDTAGEVYRLYEAALGRTPDPVGLSGWVHSLDAGQSLKSVADGFITSAEFQSTYGALDNAGFVTQLYSNVLHRAPDSAGQSYWLGVLNAGATRSQVLLGFSESPENITDSTPAVQQGLWVQDPNAAQVARLYDTALGRLPDAGGETYWTHQLQNGTDTLLQVSQGFVSSPEFQSAYGGLNNSDFVNLLYQNSLHRGADAAGQAYWVGVLAAGGSRAQVVEGFSESPEHIHNTAAHIDQGIWYV